MDLLRVIVLLLGMLSLAVFVLMLRDIEVQKKMFRRYARQIEETGVLQKQVKWWEMRFNPFVWSGWFYILPSPNDRPDLYSHAELREIRTKIRMNYRIIPWVAGTLALCVGLLFWLIA